MTDEYVRRDIIDNETDGLTMAKALCSELPRAQSFDVSTGYFDVAGYACIHAQLNASTKNNKFKVRILLGKDSLVPPDGSFEAYASMYGRKTSPETDNNTTSPSGVEYTEPKPIQNSLDDSPLARSTMDDATSLIHLLEKPNVMVRKGPARFNHSKCYILVEKEQSGKYEGAAFIGSSNMTAAGLTKNYELNAGLYQPSMVGGAKEWFDRMWNQATDTKDTLLAILRASKFGTPPDPYQVYMKMLFEKYRRFIQDYDDHPRTMDVRLTKFQRHAVTTTLHLMDIHRGAIIADSTGLGKTNMGMEIIRQKMLDENRRIMLVAPRQVIDSVWKEKLKDANITVREMVSMESMGRDEFNDTLHKYHKIDMVVIDESQNFRSKGAKRRHNLMRVLSVGKEKQVLLLTATPINNSLMDLYYQLSIITKGDDGAFWNEVRIPDLYKHMRNAANKDLEGGLEKIQQLLDNVMIRRTRSFIEEVYPDDTVDGRKIKFPKHEYEPIRYDMAGLFEGIFDKVFEDMASLTMAPYAPDRYNTSLSDEERKAHGTLASLQVVFLLKRFESSTEAIRTSLANRIRMYEHVERLLLDGRILHVGEFNDVVAKWGRLEISGESEEAGDGESELVEMVKKIDTEKAGREYDVKSMLADIATDLKTLRGLYDAIVQITVDKKFEAVRDTIMRDKALSLGGRKALIFTEYTDTAKYLHRKLQAEFPDKKVELIHGGIGTDARQRSIKRFAPKANLSEDETLEPGEESDILVSTEVLSEGQNLQDSNYVISYDLPWNPMRIVQRTGRVDRLTSNHDTVHSRACYPDKELDKLLKLIGKLTAKIEVASDVVGIDMELLGTMPNNKEFNGRMAIDIKTLAKHGTSGGDGGASRDTLSRHGAKSDLMPGNTLLQEIMRHVSKIGFDEMKSVPLGRRSGICGEGQKLVLAYRLDRTRTGKNVFEETYFAVYDYNTGMAKVPDDDLAAIRLVMCGPDEPPHLPMDIKDHRGSFDELVRIDKIARHAIGDRDIGGAKEASDLRKNLSRRGKVIPNLKDIIFDASDSGNVPAEDCERAIDTLNAPQMRAWSDRLHDIWRTHSKKNDAKATIDSILAIAKTMRFESRDAETADHGNIDVENLVLIGAMFIMGDYEPSMTKGKIDAHIN